MQGDIKPGPAPDPMPGRVRYVFANVDFDEWLGRLRVDGQPMDVEPRPLQLLAELLRRVNEVVTKEELLDAVWSGRPTVDHVLANAVSKLRGALGPAGAARLATLPRVGYRLSGPVQRLPGGSVQQRFESGQTLPGRDGYVLERPLGQGGHSDVWLARHSKLGQAHVFKLAENGSRLAALKREYTLYRVMSQSLGLRIDLPRIIDANFQTAPFYLECEYAGRSLLEWADDGAALSDLPVPERVDIFLRVARAVATAHSVGVLHKDVKPGNVLIEGQRGAWSIKLTDFGSGRLLEPERLAELQLTALGLTQSNDLATGTDRSAMSGTVMYMAPELLAGQAATVQVDVYSLGVLLFQLLVGDLRRPLVTGWQRDVSDELLRADVTAATEGDPVERLASVAALVERVSSLGDRRAQIQLHVEAQTLAKSSAERIEQARARRPWVVGTIALLVIGFATSLGLQLKATQASREATAATKRADAINEFLTIDLLASDELAAAGGQRSVTLLELLARAQLAVPRRFANQPRTEAAVRLHLARTMERLSSVTEASIEFEKAAALMAGLLGAGHPETLHINYERVLLEFEMNRPDAGSRLFEETARLTDAALLNDDRDLSHVADRAQIQVQLLQSKLDAARATATKLVKAADHDFPESLSHRIEARRLLAITLARSEDVAATDAVLAELARAPFDNRGAGAIAASRVDFSRAANARIKGQFRDAERLLLATIERLGRSDTPSAWHLGYAHSELGHVYNVSEQHANAAKNYTIAIEHFRSVLGPDHQYVRITAINLAERKNSLGLHAEALARCLENEAWFKENTNSGRYTALEVAASYSLLGLGRPAEALKRLTQFEMPDPDKVPTSETRWIWDVQLFRAAALIGVGRAAEGQQLAADVRAKLSQANVQPSDSPALKRYLGTSK